MARVGAGALYADRRDLLETTRVTLRVYPNDLDANLHLNNGRYLVLADLGRADWFMRTGMLAQAARRGALPIISDALAKFRRELKLLQRFEIETRLAGWEKRWLFLEHRFVHAGSTVGVVAVRVVLRARRRTLDPSEILEALGRHHASPPLPAWIAHWNAGSEALAAQLRAGERAKNGRAASPRDIAPRD